MALRFRRSIKIAPGLRVNLGKKGASISAGVRGASMTFGKNGTYANVGIPGTGLSYREKVSGNSSTTRTSSRPSVSINEDCQLDIEHDGKVVLLDEYGGPLAPKYLKEFKARYPEQLASFLEDECSQFNEDIDSILNIHTQTPSLSAYRTYKPAAYPFPAPTAPAPKEYGLLARLFPFLRKSTDQFNATQQEEYEQAHQKWAEEKLHFDEEEHAIQHLYDVTRYEGQDGKEEFLEYALQSIGWPRETLINFELLEEGKKIYLDVDLPEIEDLPNTFAQISTTGLRLNIKKRSETQVRKDYMKHIHGIGFRLIGTTLAALPDAQEVIISGYSQRLNEATGNIKDEYLYSSRATREDWSQINLQNTEAIDPVETLSSFEIIRKMTKTGVFKAIAPL